MYFIKPRQEKAKHALRQIWLTMTTTRKTWLFFGDLKKSRTRRDTRGSYKWSIGHTISTVWKVISKADFNQARRKVEGCKRNHLLHMDLFLPAKRYH